MRFFLFFVFFYKGLFTYLTCIRAGNIISIIKDIFLVHCTPLQHSIVFHKILGLIGMAHSIDRALEQPKKAKITNTLVKFEN